MALLTTPLLLLALGSAVEWEIGALSEARAHGSASDGSTVSGSAEVELDPHLSGKVGGRSGDVAASYRPRLYLLTGSGETSLQVLQQGELALQWRAAPGVRLFARERAAYGQTDLSPVSQPIIDPKAPLQASPNGPLAYQMTETTAGLEAGLGKHSRLALSGGWLVSGGANAAARVDLPLQRGPLADLSVTADVSRIDSVATQLAATSAMFSTGMRTTVGTAEELWTRSLGWGFGLRLGAGAGVTATRQGSAATSVLVLPVGEAGLSYKPTLRLQKLELSVAMRGAPVVDRLTGEAYEQVQVDAAFAWAPVRIVKLNARLLIGVITTGVQKGGSLGALEVGAVLATGPIWSVGAGVRAARQGAPQPFTDFGGFVNFTAVVNEKVL
jgi:hypothetical protein